MMAAFLYHLSLSHLTDHQLCECMGFLHSWQLLQKCLMPQAALGDFLRLKSIHVHMSSSLGASSKAFFCHCHLLASCRCVLHDAWLHAVLINAYRRHLLMAWCCTQGTYFPTWEGLFWEKASGFEESMK